MHSWAHLLLQNINQSWQIRVITNTLPIKTCIILKAERLTGRKKRGFFEFIWKAEIARYLKSEKSEIKRSYNFVVINIWIQLDLGGNRFHCNYYKVMFESLKSRYPLKETTIFGPPYSLSIILSNLYNTHLFEVWTSTSSCEWWHLVYNVVMKWKRYYKRADLKSPVTHPCREILAILHSQQFTFTYTQL